VVPTIGFNLLYVLVIVWLARRELVWIDVTDRAPDHRMDCAARDLRQMVAQECAPALTRRAAV